MKDARYWTIDKIEILKFAFLQGSKLKEITKILGKSPSALNKALDRFGIRLERQRTQYIEWSLNDPYCQSAIPSFLRIKEKKAYQKQESLTLKEIKKTLKETSICVSLYEVTKYLKKKGLPLKKLSTPLLPEVFIDAKFLLNYKPLTPLQLLLIANEMRLEEKQPIFLVEEVTWW